MKQIPANRLGAALGFLLAALCLSTARGEEKLVDVFTKKAHRDYMDLPEEAIRNRELLERVMTTHGFIGLPTEWWHFDDRDWKRHPIMDVDFSELP